MKFGTGSSASGGGEHMSQPKSAVRGAKHQIINKDEFPH
jgi:hypothetical protein